ncbi:hypothetical protein [Roseivirga sp. E12]|uniref:hypothetical protein n=1 Tax=Roseivirga sp. E12 TaxID=2819237 RepID=UPI001ABCE75B|nr:hypothetical protein [Roseivirga sp. E12]MBO3700520.1 hypothetical protein [Roseivirga sp. E12]
MKKSYIISIVLVVLITLSCSAPTSEVETWQLVYRNDSNGEALSGNKAELIDAVRNGLPIRIGFGGRSQVDTTRSVEHTADAQFLSIIDGEEVFAQITQIIGQAPARERDGTKIRFRTNNKWTSIRGTNGYATGLMVDYLADTLAGTPADSKRGTSWFVYKKKVIENGAKPLYD